MLEGIYSKTLATLEETVPAGAEYRNVVEALTKKRLAVVQGSSDLAAIEAQIGAGQVEQLIQQAQDELDLIPKMAAARVWEPYQGSPVEELYTDLKRCPHAPAPQTTARARPLLRSPCRRGIAIQRHDIPMQQSLDFPTAENVELLQHVPPEEPEK